MPPDLFHTHIPEKLRFPETDRNWFKRCLGVVKKDVEGLFYVCRHFLIVVRNSARKVSERCLECACNAILPQTLDVKLYKISKLIKCFKIRFSEFCCKYLLNWITNVTSILGPLKPCFLHETLIGHKCGPHLELLLFISNQMW